MERWSMQASSVAGRLKQSLKVTDWAWWRLPIALRLYVATVIAAAAVTIGIGVAQADWRASDLAKFLLLACCAVVSVVSTPRIAYTVPGVTRDFTTVWVLPIAMTLPPVYAAVVPIPMFLVMRWFVHRGVLHRAVFTAASMTLPYACASLIFHSIPSSFAGGSVGLGLHAFTWAIAVTACEIFAGRVQHFFVAGAVKLTNPQVKVWEMQWKREALQGLFVALDLGVLITLAVALSPAFVLLALPTVLLVRRFLVHPVLLAQSRVDAKTGLLNVSTWEREAEIELSRSARTRQSLALAIMDIDHFKRVNDTYGHGVGDEVIKTIADILQKQKRASDTAGRLGGEEFALILPEATLDSAVAAGERLRKLVAEHVIAAGGTRIPVTISVGASICHAATSGVEELLQQADLALYEAKRSGRNRVCRYTPPAGPDGSAAAQGAPASDAASLASKALESTLR
jgi:diguanylate cyclase (GGDEF)-like protein